MKILVAGSFRYETYAKAFYEAFRRMGHTVRSLDTEQFELKEDNPLSLAAGKVKRHWLISPAIGAASRALKREVSQFRPDLVFLYHCYFLHPSAVKEISCLTTVFSCENDDPFEKRSDKPNASYYIKAARHCRLNYVFRHKNVEDFARIGVDNAKVLLPYYLETRNYPLACGKDIPLAFAGHWEDDGRDRMIVALLDAGLPFELYGDAYSWGKSRYWPQLQGCFHGAVYGEKYNELLNRMQVSLVFFSKANNDTYTRRCFELPVSKAVMLSEYTSDMDSFWPEGECCAYFRSEEDLVQKASYLLAHPDEVHRLAENAFTRLKVLGGSDADRAREVIADYERTVRGKNPL